MSFYRDLPPTPSKPHVWRLTPGSVVARVVELMRFLPRGTELRTADFFSRLELKRCHNLPKQLEPAVNHGLLRRELRRVSGGSGRAVFWTVGDVSPGQLSNT